MKIRVAGTTTDHAFGDFYRPENASLVFVSSVSVLSDTELIVTDTYNHMIKKVNINAKNITPLTIGPKLSYPRGTVVGNDEIYFADFGNHCIRKIDVNGAISDVGICGNGGCSSDGTHVNNAQLFYPSSVVVDSNGDLFIADSGNHIIRKVSGGFITTIAGIPGEAKFSGSNESALDTHLYEPTDLAIAPNGQLYLSDHGNHCIRKVDASDKIQTVAGQCGKRGFSGDGRIATRALLSHPRGLAFTKAGDLLIADFGNSVIRKVDMGTGNIMTVAGISGSVGYTGDGGLSTSAQLNRPTGIAVGSSGEYYVADFGNHLIRVVQPTHTCDGVSNKNSTVCSGNGACVTTDTCRCYDGYSGLDCSTANCFGTWSNETSVCSNHGACVAANLCTCEIGYGGGSCSLNICYGVMSNESSVCSNHGKCNSPNDCTCNEGYDEYDCSSITPTGGSIHVLPESGTLLITRFNLATNEWKPADQALEYRFGVVDPSTNEILFLNLFSTSPTLTTTLPFRGVVTVVVECRSTSGYSQRQNTSIIVVQPTAQDLSNYVAVRNETLLTANNAEFESEFTIMCSAIPSIVETLDSQQGSSFISNLVDTMTARKDDLSVERKVQNAKLLSNEIQLFDKDSVLTY